jgi:PAS domain S-box-containing protein
MVVWIWEMDENGVYTYCSERVENILGYTPEEIVGRHFVDLMPPHEAKKIRDAFHRITEQKKILQDFENWNIHKKGHRVCLMSSGVPIVDEEGNLRGYRGVHKNITDQKRAEKALKEANKQLKKMDRLKSDFVSMVSHEIRTPITIMKEGISLCLEGITGELTDMQQELLNGILESVFRLQRLVTELLDLSKIEDGNLELHRSTIDLRDVAQQVQNDYKNQAIDKKIRLHLSKPPEPVSAHVDRDKIIQVFHNLVSNAIRYTERGGDIWIRIEDTRDKEIVCSVSDTGIGIAEENMRDLFSKFKQFGQPKGSDYKGTGLGLAIAKGLVEKHGGRMWVESEPGKGSTFYFSIPRVNTTDLASGKKVKAF